MDKLLGSLEHAEHTAKIYETALPGQFAIRYFDPKGLLVGEEELSGVSSYRQREREILARLQTFAEGRRPDAAGLADPGEY